ncbi:hypothetical protein VT84_34300 [Gemmata sp. SH-PL17]|uniref:hypothetical protein n=1 Tax=Gemmata sp. SH-PL17 TaxID=1630693 RepID=UPI0004BA8D57|nr:hypothetical protein [Gemmata sp. SH-PL17]AMV29517.1 hypothetical protein VT84_34300 [Gemmata sp. SH-PL17]
MPRFTSWLCIGIAIGFASLADATAPHAAAAPVPKHLMPKEPRFAHPTRVGTTWVYDVGNKQESTRQISQVEEKNGAALVTTEYVHAGGKRSHHMTLSVSDKGIYLVAEHGSTYPVPWCIFKLPHKEGQTWTTEGHGGDMKSGPVEKVKTPAGEILAARVDWECNPGQVVSYWYADGFGLVRMSGPASVSLKSFTSDSK